jgi:two-component system CheB/CheR fusion protein
MPSSTGVAFVVVTHQHPGHVSLLPDIIARNTKLSVVEVQEPTRLEPDRIYLGSPGGLMFLEGGRLRVEELEAEQSPHLPIDHFLRSLAADQGEQAICVILSGTGSDGTLGLRAVKAESGMAMVQTPQSAKYASMPASAQSTGMADYVLAPGEMPEQLLAYVRGPYLQKPRPRPHIVEDRIAFPRELVNKILNLIKRKTGHDFSQYKEGTIQRRIERRMNLHQIRKVSAYFDYLKENPREIDLLLSELLITVTSFFRDPGAFEALSGEALPELLRHRAEGEIVRAWVVGCATGEEAYSVAILLHESIEKTEAPVEIQIFATDLDDHAIRSARQGRYPAGIEADVPPERLEKYFHKDDNFYQVRKVIRDMIVFAPQNVTKDPPFTKLDLIVCRNLLIYLDTPLQRKVLELLHYSLRSGGLLFLGPSETLGRSSDLFDTLDQKWKIYRRKEATRQVHPVLDVQAARSGDPEGEARPAERQGDRKPRTTREIERLLLSRFAPASLVVDERGEILYIHGRTGEYLEPAAGEQPRSNVSDMAREGLGSLLTAGIRQASTRKQEVVRRNVRVKTNGAYAFVDVTVTPLKDPEPIRGTLLVTLRPAAAAQGGEESAPSRRSGKKKKKRGEESFIDQKSVEEELQYTRESLKTTIEELETSNEELKSSNEELQSTNEELASTNEELETSKEELQSLNEELTTVNAELESKVNELARVNDDMQNLLNSTNVATIFLDQDLKVKRYTQKAREMFSLIAGDLGRPLQDLSSKFHQTRLYEDCQEVLTKLVPKEMEVETEEGQTHMMRIMPYRTVDNVIEGVVLTFVQIDQLRERQGAAGAGDDRWEEMIRASRGPMLVLDRDLQVLAANSAFHRTFRTRPADVRSRRLYELNGGAWDTPELRRLLEEVLPAEGSCSDFRVEHEFPSLGRRSFLVNARRLSGTPGDGWERTVIGVEDVTEEAGT